ncbi:MAG TPA: TonB-dependent receptor, partial [Flavobacterium sp.]|nr:TonB-dependent receptor [Flavobacterium sp.]
HVNHKLNDLWSTSLFVHGNARLARNDMNHDMFLDNPLGEQVNIMNRWQYNNVEKGLVSFLSARFMTDRKMSGDLHFDPNRDKLTANHWGSEIFTDRLDLSGKFGYVFPEMPFQSIGFQSALTIHNQDSYFGLSQYDISQKSFYSNLVFNSIIGNTMHKFSTGMSFMYDGYDEWVDVPGISRSFDRIDNSLGAFW